MRLFAISDLHLNYPENRDALLTLPALPEDCLALVGDIGEAVDHLRFAFEILACRFKRLIWVPGNHELWTSPEDTSPLTSEEKYNACVDLARSCNVLTPEDPYPLLEFDGESYHVCPLHTLYDYTFGPSQYDPAEALEWARKAGIRCLDEIRLNTAPYPSIVEWCHARCELTENRLMQLNGARTILINHYPLRHDLVYLPRIPRFSIWCGTTKTTDWHTRFNASLVLSGHLHIPSTRYRDKVRFEEVSFGYPREWLQTTNINRCLRQVLPAIAPKVGLEI